MDEIGTLIIALSLGLIGGVIIVWLASSMLLPLLRDTRAFAERVRFRQREKVLESADTSIGKNEYSEALNLLVLAFFYDPVRTDKELIEKIHNHHVGILSRILLVAEKLSRRIENLAVIEDLVLARSEMLRSLYEARQNKLTLAARRSRGTPQWALDEYAKKIEEILDKLKTNQRSLVSQMQRAIDQTKGEQREQEITYH